MKMQNQIRKWKKKTKTKYYDHLTLNCKRWKGKVSEKKKNNKKQGKRDSDRRNKTIYLHILRL